MITENRTSLKTKLRQEPRLAWVSGFPSGTDLVCYCLELQHREHFAEGQTNDSVWVCISCISRFILTMQVAGSKLEKKYTTQSLHFNLLLKVSLSVIHWYNLELWFMQIMVPITSTGEQSTTSFKKNLCSQNYRMQTPPWGSKNLSLAAEKSYLWFVLHCSVSLSAKEPPRTLANPWGLKRNRYGEKPQMRHGCHQFIMKRWLKFGGHTFYSICNIWPHTAICLCN